MEPSYTLRSRAGQTPALRAALEEARANSASPSTEAPNGDVRSRMSERLGLQDPSASNEEIFAALDSTLAAAEAKRAHVDAQGALYNTAWAEPRTAPEPLTFASDADAALYAAAWGV